MMPSDAGGFWVADEKVGAAAAALAPTGPSAEVAEDGIVLAGNVPMEGGGAGGQRPSAVFALFEKFIAALLLLFIPVLSAIVPRSIDWC